MKTSKKWLSLLLILALTLTVLAGCGSGDTTGAEDDVASDETFVWKMQCAYPPGDMTYDIQMPMVAEAITEATDGRITFELYIPGAICEPAQAPMSVAKGLLDAAISAPNDCAAIVPAAYAEGGIPGYWNNGQDVYDTFYEFGMLEFLQAEYAKAGLYYGAYVPCGAYNLMTNFPVDDASSLKGKKIRAASSFATFMEQLGAAPVIMPGGDIYMGMKLGTIDGNIYTISELGNAKLKEVTKYIIEPALSGSAPVNMIIGEKSWEAIGPELQEIVAACLQDTFMEVYEASKAIDDAAVKDALAYGTEMYQLSDKGVADFIAAGEEVSKVLSEKYPDAAPGFDIIMKWKASVQ